MKMTERSWITQVILLSSIAWSSMTQASYAENDPINFVDPSGLSARDAQLIEGSFLRYVSQLNNTGLRYPGSPAMNNILSSINQVNSNWGAPYLSCYQQAYGIQQQLASGTYDDKWSFDSSGSNLPHIQPQSAGGFGILPHHWVTGTSSNPNDPLLIIDPWKNIFLPLPRR